MVNAYPLPNTIARRAPTTWLCRLSSSGPAHVLGCRPPMAWVGICHRGVVLLIWSGILALIRGFPTEWLTSLSAIGSADGGAASHLAALLAAGLAGSGR